VNGWDVAIVKVEQILGLNFAYEGNLTPGEPFDKYISEQKMRTFIRRVYEGKHAYHITPNKRDYLGYVLLVGDNYAGNTGMPTSFDGTTMKICKEKVITYASDYYFSCVKRDATGKYSDVGQFAIGRFSVETAPHLYNMVHKTIEFEREYVPKKWRKTALFTYGSFLDSTYVLGRIHSIENSSAFKYNWTPKFANWHTLNGKIKEPTIAYMNEGASFMQYFGHGCDIMAWQDTLNIDNFSTRLNNGYKAPFISSSSCENGRFDNYKHHATECLGEFLTRYDSIKGATGFIGASRIICSNPSNYFLSFEFDIFKSLFSNSNSIPQKVGKELLSAKLNGSAGYSLQNKHAFNLLGDPALDFFPEGYEVTKDVTAEIPCEINKKVYIRNGATLTTSALIVRGTVIVEDGAALIANNLIVQGTAILEGSATLTTSDLIVRGNVILEDSANLIANNIKFDNEHGSKSAIIVNEGCTLIANNLMFKGNSEKILIKGTVSILVNGIVNVTYSNNLVVEESGNLIFGNNVKVIYKGGYLAYPLPPIIHIKGGGFSVGSGVEFRGENIYAPNNIYFTILLENDSSAQVHYDKYKPYNFNNCTFSKVPIINKGGILTLSNCTFENISNVKTTSPKTMITNCTFNNSVVISEHTDFTGNYEDIEPRITILNSTFQGNNTNTAIKLKNTLWFNIHGNTISGYNTGLFLENCGATVSKNRGEFEPPIGEPIHATLITDNQISSCTSGIELYNTVASVKRNFIHDNDYGVRLYNNSYTDFENNPQAPYQIIQDCSAYELYADDGSFPTIFLHNQVIDEDNLGNDFNDPLIYWDKKNTFLLLKAVVNFNYWGINFNKAQDLYPSKYFICDSLWQPSKSGAPLLGDDENLYQTGLDYFANEDFTNAEATFKELIETYPESRFTIAAMHELFALEHFTDNDFYKLYGYLTSFTPADSNLFNVADFLATRCHVKEKNWQPAINWYENRIENPPSYQDSIFAVIDLGDIHLMMEKDTLGSNGAKASHCSYRLENVKPKSKQEYETNKTNLLATLPQIPHLSPQTPNPKPHTYRKGVLGECVPNPTNGNATIYYEIFTEGIAEIRIYNAMGQLVKSVEQKTSIGRFKSKISFAGFPAGLYHYTLFVNGERTDSKKVVVR